MRLLALLFIFSLSNQAFAKSRAPKIELSPPVVTKLESILVKADELRQALVGKQDTLATARTRDLVRTLVEAIRTSDPDKLNKQHLDRILNDTQKNLEQFSVARGDDRKSNLQNAFKQIVLIGQTYKVKDEYKFFFCNRDRSVWLQKESKPQNPVNPESYLNCGTRVE